MNSRASLFLGCWLGWAVSASAGITFDAVDDDLPIPAESAINIEEGPLTISAWVYITDYNANLIDRIFGKGGTGFTTLEGANTALIVNALSFQKDFATTDLVQQSSDNTLSQDAWHHVLVTWDGSATAANVHLYIDGTEPSYQTTTNGVGAEASDSTGLWHIGNNATPGVRQFGGTIDEAACWDVELTAQEIAQLASSRVKRLPLQIRPANLRAYYPMDDQAGGSSADGDAVEDITRVSGNGTGDNGANNTGLTWASEAVLSYP